MQVDLVFKHINCMFVIILAPREDHGFSLPSSCKIKIIGRSQPPPAGLPREKVKYICMELSSHLTGRQAVAEIWVGISDFDLITHVYIHKPHNETMEHKGRPLVTIKLI